MHIQTSDQPGAIRQREEASDVDTHETVAGLEQTLIETFNINLAGHTMNQVTTALEVATQNSEAHPVAALVRSRHTYLDLFQWLDEHLESPQLKARVFSSMAWMLDIFTINVARNIFFQMHEDARLNGIDLTGEGAQHIDSYNEFMKFFTTHDIADALQASFYTGTLQKDGTVEINDDETGTVLSEQSSEPWRDLLLMVKLHRTWHAAAAQQLDATRSVVDLKRNYAVKGYEELVMDEKPYVDQDENTKLMALGQIMAPKQATEIGEMFIRAREQAAKDRIRSNKENAGLVLRIIAEAQARGDEDEEPEFHELSLNMQRRLCMQASRAIARSIEQLAKVKTIVLVDYIGMAQIALAAKAELNALIDEKFGDQD